MRLDICGFSESDHKAKRTHSHTLTQFIDCVDVSMTSDELLHHALYCQPCCQDQCRRAIIHTGVQICGAISDQNLDGESWIRHYDSSNACATISYRHFYNRRGQ